MTTATTFKSLLKATAIIVCLVGPQLVAAEAQARVAGNYVTPTGDALATDNQTAYSGSLFCLADNAHRRGWTAPRIAVGQIGDLTGKSSLDEGAKVTQGASLFAITALGKAGLPVVERLDSSVSDIELNYAKQHLLSDSPERAGVDPNNYRKIFAGQIAGSGYYIVGGVTELNNNIKSTGHQLAVSSAATSALGQAGQGQITSRKYVLNVGVDLRLVNSRTQEVVKTVSFQKQILGHETDGTLGGSKSRKILGLNGGTSAIEPIQAGVRALIELGVYQLADYVYTGKRGSGCMTDSSQKYTAVNYPKPTFNGPVYDDPRQARRYVQPTYAQPRAAAPAYDNRYAAPVNQAPQAHDAYQYRYEEPTPPPYPVMQSRQSARGYQAQYQGSYQVQAQPRYAPQPQYQQPNQGQYEEIPRYLRETWNR